MRRFLTVIGCVLALTLPSGDVAKADDRTATTPSPRDHGGARWRIGYFEGGPHGNYYQYLSATVEGLMKLGWLPDQEIPKNRARDTKALWLWLTQHVQSDYVEFVPDGYYSANWDPAVRAASRNELVARLSGRNDIDLMIAMGTWAGKDLANDRHDTPTVVMSSSDPIGSGIVSSPEDSGLDHVHARVDPFRYERQLRVFHDIIGFRRLGVAYEDSDVGRTYAAIELVEKVAKERGFEVVRCHTKSDIADQGQAAESVVGCFKRLVNEVDAIYVTVQGGVNSRTIPQLVRLTNVHRVPTFSQLGSEEVRYGFLLSISRAGGFQPAGRFLAATMAKIFNRAKPRDLNQIFEDLPNIAINLKTAEQVGLYLYADVLAAADEIYREIDVPQ